jgi:tagaturonate reductase
LQDEWQLEEDFIKWVRDCNYFTNTLVDRIVTGYPKDEIDSMELGYEDNLVVAGEVFHFFAIEVPNDYALRELHEKLPFHKAGLNIVLTNDVTPYKLRKVRILNGAHTSSVLAARLCGIETVGEMMKDPLFVKYIRKGIFDEIIPSLDLLHEDMISFAEAVFDRFANPYIKHYLLSIALNSVAKYNARVLSTIFDYYKKFKLLPEVLTLSFAALIAFYTTDEASDVDSVMDWFKKWRNINSNKTAIAELVNDVCANTDFWDGKDLTKELPGFAEKVTEHLQNIKSEDSLSLAEGMRNELERILKTVEAGI